MREEYVSAPVPHSPLMMAEAGAGNGGAVTDVTESASHISVSASPGPEAEAAIDRGRDDLTVFFAIGVVIDVLMVTAFLIWAVGQWRKTKK